MALTSCWRCLRLPPRFLNPPVNRGLLPHHLPLRPRSTPFSTTSAHLANPIKKQSSNQGHQKAIMAKQKTSTNKYHHKKKKRDIMPPKRLFEAGERRVLRKNIVLSNTNAPALPLPEMTLDICGMEETEGTVFQIPDSALDSLKALGAFKTGQHWPYFQRPSTLIRKGSVEIGKLILWINGGEVAEGSLVDGVAAKGEPVGVEVAGVEVAGGEVAEGDIAEAEAEAEAAKGEAAKGAVAKGELAEGDIAEAEAAKGEAAKGELAEAEAAKGEPVGVEVEVEVAGGEVAEGGIAEAEAEGEAAKGEATKGEVANGEERYTTRILDGTRGSGKSILLAQAMNWAIQSKWVVISIPNAQDLVLGHTEYEFDPAWGLWVQKEYAAALLARILKANGAVLRQLNPVKTHKIGKTEINPPSLVKLVALGIQDPQISHDVFMALLKELSMPGRPPVLFALDNLNQISLPSAYRDPSFDLIHAHDLALPNTFLSYLSGVSRFPRGLVLAATSSVCSKTKDLSNALQGIGPRPWDKTDERVVNSVKGVEVVQLEKLSKEEVKVVMEWYNVGGMLKQPVTIESVTEQYAISSGNPKELFQNCLRLKY